VVLPFEVPAGLTLETDVGAASWIDERLRPRRDGAGEGVLVGKIVPEGFEAYTRILHPAWRRVGDGYEPVRWSELARERGKRIHPEVQLKALLGEDFRDGPPWGELPFGGSLPDELREPLVATLRGFTHTPDPCWFCIWEGYGFWGGGNGLTWSGDEAPRVIRSREREARRRAEAVSRLLDRIPKAEVMQRRYFLFRGAIDAVIPLKIGGIWSQSPNYWWPEDRTWIVVSELDAPCTYVGGSEELVRALSSVAELEVVTSGLEHRFDWFGDRVNVERVT
jgi:hypothetical protein